MDDESRDHLSLDMWLEHVLDFDLNAAISAASGMPETFAELVRRADEFGIGPEDFADHVGTAWLGVADQHLDYEGWRALFEAAGYREDDEPAARPPAPLVLWRGALPEFRSNWSWTNRYDTAHGYASGWVQHEIGLVWRAVVDPDRLFARLTLAGNGVYEYVVDTDGLVIEPHSLWCRCPVDLSGFRGGVEDARLALDLHELVQCLRGTDGDPASVAA